MIIITFLIVDDTPSYRALLVGLVQQQPDWSVVGEASDGAEAVQMALRLEPDVVFMDITLPVISGIEATQQIKQALHNTRVLIFTAYDDEEFRQASQRAGADFFIRKEDLDVDMVKRLIAFLFSSS